MSKSRILKPLAALALCAGAWGCAAAPYAGPHAGGGAEIGAFGVALENMDPSVDPGDDFYRYVNGAWLDSFEIPADRSNYGSFTRLAERSEAQTRAIIEEAAGAGAAPGSDARKIGDLYASFMDREQIEALGLAPAQPMLAQIAAAQTHDDLAVLFATPGMTAPISAFVNVDFKDPEHYAVYLTQSGLGLPDRDYYLSEDERFAQIRENYLVYIEDLLSLAGDQNAPDHAQAIMALETRLAKAHWERARRRDRSLTYNPMTPDALAAFAPGIPWLRVLDASGLGDQTKLVVREKDAFPKIAQIFTETPIGAWRAYLSFHYLRANAPYLPAAFDDLTFAFFNRDLRGQPEQRPRWKRGVSLVNGALGEAVGRLYVERHFPPESKEAMDALVENLRVALESRIDALDWMSEATKDEARAKLAAFTPKIGYPVKWRDYSAMTIHADDLLGNVARANEWSWNYQISRLGGPVDKTEWGMTPQTVNAYYSPPRNEIVFPAAILQAPFFDARADAAVNYGAIGAVIGHEMGHGFDDQGRKTDGAGALRDWWTQEDAQRFEARAARLGAQFAAYEPLPGAPLNAKLTMGENIGDLGGLAMAYHAYRLSLGGVEAPIIDGYTGDQRFFMAWAQIWARLYREDELRRRIVTDPHSPSEYRVNGIVRNMDAWYDAFHVRPGEALYLPPGKRVSIW